jgi:hypothetical protein
MNRYILIRRLRGPVFLLLVGALALLNQANILPWGKSWPLFLILAGVMALAERAAMATEESHPPPPFPGTYQGGPNPASPAPGPIDLHATPVTPQPPVVESSAIVPAYDHDFGKNDEGGQS